MLWLFGFLLWLGFCGAVATAADTRGRSFGGWFLLAFLFTPLLAVCFLLASPKVDREQKRRPTPEQIAAVPSGLRAASIAAAIALAVVVAAALFIPQTPSLF